MENLIVLLFDFGLVAMYLFIGFISFLVLQLISYKIFKFNLYKKICELLEKK